MQVRANHYAYYIVGFLFFVMAPAFAQKMEAQLSSELIDYANREVQSSLTAEQIGSVRDESLVQLIKDNMLSKMKKDLSDETSVFNNFSPGRKVIYTVWQIEAEVNNGGFHQLFTSTAGNFAANAEEAFRELRAPLFAELLRQVNEERRKGSGSTNWKEFDEKFFALYDREDLQKLKIEYIRNNSHDFTDN